MDKELIEAALKGDQTAFRMLYQIHEKAVRGRVSGYFKWKADVDDVVSESFKKSFGAMSAFDTAREFRPWLLTIASRTALDHLDRMKREDRKKEEQGDESHLTEETPEEEIIRDELHQRLMQYIDELPSLYKDVMIKYMIEELDYEEIARQLDLELNTVRTRIRRGKQHLSEMMLRGETQ